MSLNTFSMPRPKQPSAVLKYEVSPELSRESATLLAGNVAAIGAVLGKITASGKLVPLDRNAADGSQTFYGVSIVDVDATAADADIVVVRRLAKLSASGLVWLPANDATEQAAVLAEAAAAFVIVGNY